jgi:ATP-binding cassette subfamily B protein
MTTSKAYLESSKYPLFRLFNYMRGYRRDYLLAILYSLLNKLFDIFPEILIGGAVAVVVNRHESWLAKLTGLHAMLPQLFILGGLTFAAWLLESFFQYLYSLKWRNLAQKVEHDLRLDTYNHVQSAQLKEVHKTSTGQLIATINDDINQLERFLEDGLNQIVQIIGSTIMIGIIFLLCSPFITLFAILPIPVILFGAFFFQHKLAPRFLQVRFNAAKISEGLASNLQGLLTIKSYTNEKFESQRLEKLSMDYQEANRVTIQISSMVTPVIRIAVLTGFLCTLLIGGYQTINHSMNVGVFSLLIFLSQRLLWPFSRLAEVTVNYQRVMASTTRALNLLTWKSETDSGEVCAKDLGLKAIHFSEVSFRYDDNLADIFKQFNLEIGAGKTVAFVGESGSGKSSLIKLLCRFYEPTAGKILYGQKPIEDFSKQAWRQQIALVSQEVFLFFGSVRDNIAYANPQASEEAVIKAAKMAGAHEFIEQLPEGYDSQVGEQGVSLSGGQRQRIAIARAIIKDAPILILDEATSAVDNETELAIQRAIEHLAKDRTTIIIAHRLSTIRNADNVFVMENGAIAESGSHDELVARGGKYARLWAIQTGEHV